MNPTAPSISREMVRSMSILAIALSVIYCSSAYAFYWLLLKHNPSIGSLSCVWMPTIPELAWMASIALCGVLMAFFISIKLAKRILQPIQSVLENVRRVADGDLSARATADAGALGETHLLVDRFNAMAERLEHSAKEVATWNAAIAHELRTPVTVLKGRLQGLADGVFAPEEAQFRSLLAQVDGLSRLIEDLRMLSLFEAGRMQLQLAPADLVSEIRGVVALLAPDAEKLGFRIVVDLVDRPITCDAARIRQALLALLDNAWRYAQPGEVRIETRISDSQCRLCVEDSGPGLDDDIAASAFDTRPVSNWQPRVKGGSGLGLTVVRAIAEAHGGTAAYCRSRRGGALFEIAWPVIEQAG